ncbi:MAG: hypothetical protein ACE5GW_08320, partial [Planctomycetota bacterium]
CVTPSGPIGPINVTVTNVDTQSATMTNGYTYMGGTPTLTAVNPNSGTTGGGTAAGTPSGPSTSTARTSARSSPAGTGGR